MSDVRAWSEPLAQMLVSRNRDREGPLLPILHDMQDAFGHIPDAAFPLLASALNLSQSEIHGVVSFYHDFRRSPAGRRVVKICRAEACQSMGGEAVAERLLRRLGLDWGQTTSDGAVTVEAVYCLGLCAAAPAALIDGEPVARLSAQSLAARVEELAGS